MFEAFFLFLHKVKLLFSVGDVVTPAPVTAHKPKRGIQEVDFTTQVLSTAASSSSATSQALLPPAVDFTSQSIPTIPSASSSASTQSATVKREVDFTGQVLPGQQANLVQKTESLTVGIPRTKAVNASDESNMTRRTAGLVVCINISTMPTPCVYMLHVAHVHQRQNQPNVIRSCFILSQCTQDDVC